jgi:replicative DNA helicase
MLMLLAAPAAGKTTLCQQIAESIAEHGKPVLYVNLEMSREQMIAKSLSARVTLAGEPMTALDVLQGYKWYPAHRKAVEKALDQYREKVAPNLDYNPDGITGDLEKLAAYLDTIGERAKAAGKSGPVVFIDYLHLLTWPGEETANVIKKSMEILKNYSINYDTISVAISATNRDSNRAGRITMESGRDSSGIEYTGDYILSLNYYQVDQGDVKTTDNDKMSVLTGRPWRQMIIRVLKNRFGIAGRPTRVYFHAAGNRFYAEDDFLPEDQNIVMFGDPDAELDNAGMVFNINNLELPEAKTPRAGRKR